VFLAIQNQWNRIVDDNTPSGLRLAETSATISYQPVPIAISLATQQYGGNIADMGADANRVILEYNFAYASASPNNADSLQEATSKTFKDVGNLINSFVQNRLVPNVYLPLFMNTANERQDFWLRSNARQFVASVKARVDTKKLFGNRAMGFLV